MGRLRTHKDADILDAFATTWGHSIGLRVCCDPKEVKRAPTPFLILFFFFFGMVIILRNCGALREIASRC